MRLAVIAGLLLAWILAMIYRTEIRAYWWAWQLTKAESPLVQDAYLERLTAAGDRSLGAARWLLGRPDEHHRAAGVRVLAACPDPAAERELLAALADDSESVVDEVVRVFIARPEADAVLIDALGNTDVPGLTAEIIDTLGAMRSTSAAPALAKLRTDDRPVSRLPYSYRRAVRSMQSITSDGKPAGQSAVRRALADALTVGDIADRSLQLITGKTLEAPATRPAGHDATP
jgi:hypothetical protein